MALAAVNGGAHRGTWPITREARQRLEEEAARRSRDLAATNGYVSGHLDGDTDAPTFVPNVAGQQLVRQLVNIRAVLESATIVDDADVAVIGREVTLREPDGVTSRYELVIPGEGDIAAGLVSADSPVGAALVGRRVGDLVEISAPAGTWTATLVDIA